MITPDRNVKHFHHSAKGRVISKRPPSPSLFPTINLPVCSRILLLLPIVRYTGICFFISCTLSVYCRTRKRNTLRDDAVVIVVYIEGVDHENKNLIGQLFCERFRRPCTTPQNFFDRGWQREMNMCQYEGQSRWNLFQPLVDSNANHLIFPRSWLEFVRDLSLLE